MSLRFENAIQALVQAFFNGTLGKGNCNKCAVGNICGSGVWSGLFTTYGGQQVFHSDGVQQAYGGHEYLVTKTEECGYSYLELARVEKAFELNTQIDHLDYPKHTPNEIMNDQYLGLMAVVDVLCEIEGLTTEKAHYQQMFAF